MHGDVLVSDMRHALRASEKMSLFLRFISGFLTFLSDKMFYRCSSLIQSSLKSARKFTNKQEFVTSLHLMSFRHFQNLSEETWSRAVENLIELCFIAFLSNKSKNCFILV